MNTDTHEHTPATCLSLCWYMVRHSTARHGRIIIYIFTSLSLPLSLLTPSFHLFHNVYKYTSIKTHQYANSLSIYLPNTYHLNSSISLSLSLSYLYRKHLHRALYNMILNEKVTARGYVVQMCVFLSFERAIFKTNIIITTNI